MPQNRNGQIKAGSEEPLSAAGLLLRGLGLIVLGLGLGYWYLIRPVHQAQLTGSAEYPRSALIGVPCLIYAGVALIGVMFFGDHSTRRVDANGRSRMNAIGAIFLLSVPCSMVAMIAWWIHFIHTAGVVNAH